MAGYLSRSVPPLVRLMARVRIDHRTGCWMWTGGTYGNGYGTMMLNGKAMGAHVVSWILHRGPIPKGILVCHKCDTPPCVNPWHEFLGTNQDNLRDASAKGRLKRACVLILTIDGVTKPLIDWAKAHGMPKGTLYNRVTRGWPQEKWFGRFRKSPTKRLPQPT